MNGNRDVKKISLSQPVVNTGRRFQVQAQKRDFNRMLDKDTVNFYFSAVYNKTGVYSVPF
jgi:hypothetical protein